jgi:hypothetical protein
VNSGAAPNTSLLAAGAVGAACPGAGIAASPKNAINAAVAAARIDVSERLKNDPRTIRQKVNSILPSAPMSQ